MQRVPARCSTRTLHRPKTQVAACQSTAPRRQERSALFCEAWRCVSGLFVTPPRRPGKPPEHTSRVFGNRRRPIELSYAPDPSCTAQPRAHGSKSQLNPSSWTRAVPRVCACGLQSTGSLPGEAARVAIDVLMPFHSITTTDSVES